MREEYLDISYYERIVAGKTFNNYMPTILSSRRYEQVEVSDDSLVFKLTDKIQKDTAAAVVLQMVEFHGLSYPQVIWSYTKYPQRKFTSYLFDLILSEFYNVIMSGTEQTFPGSKDFWVSLSRKQAYKVSIYNVITSSKRAYSYYTEDRIWGIPIFEEDTEYRSLYFNELLQNRDINREIYDFLMKYVASISDRSIIRLLVELN